MRHFCSTTTNRIGMLVFLAISVGLFIPQDSLFAMNYDDFSGTAGSRADESKWIEIQSGFVLSGDGYLDFGRTSGNNAKLVSTERFSSGVFTMSFLDYASNNNAPAAQGLGSVVGLGLGSQSAGKWVRIERGQVQDTGYIEVNWQTNLTADIAVNYVPSEIESGFLQLRYDGTDVIFFYRTLETDPWTQMLITGQLGAPVIDAQGNTKPLVITPGWASEVPIFVQGIPGGPYDGKTYDLNFKIDYVNVPEPSLLLLLGFSLAGVAGFRRKIIDK